MGTHVTDLNWEHGALVIIDMQNDFSLPGGAMPVAGAMEVIPSISDVLCQARKSLVPIIHIVRYYKPDGSNVDLCRREQILSGVTLVAPGSAGAEIVSELKPDPAVGRLMDADLLTSGKPQKIGPKEWIVYKSRWGAFYETDLEKFLKDQGVDSLIFMGNNFPNCPRTSIYEASERDFKLGLVTDAMSRVYEQGIEELENIGVTMLTAARTVADLKEIL